MEKKSLDKLFSVVACLLLATASAASDWSPYHERSMVALAPPSQLPNDAFFGYSIAFDRKSRELVCGAPRADNIGRLYSCDLSIKQCKWLHVDISDSHPLKEEGHFFWLGATVKADDSNLMVCAPRHLSQKSTKIFRMARNATYGRCYSKSLLSNETVPVFELLPDMPPDERQSGAHKYEDLTDSFGWSIDIAADRSARVGGPAMVKGRVMTYNMDRPQDPPSFLSGKSSTKSAINYNFGYSIASGHFLSTSQSFAVSSTYGEIGKGKVVIFENNEAMAYLDEDGEVGSMYGASLCAAQLQSATRSTLLVGAPAYFQFDEDRDRYHTGMVYVYAPGKEKLVLTKKIEGPKDGGFFGYAIVNVGDLDYDNKDEIAIAAPYEDDGAGAVYVYAGAALAQESPARPLRRLQPAGFLNFGLALTAFNYSGNGCNDLAVGAPGNDKVAVYHCLPVIHVDTSILLPDMQKRPDKTSFVLKTCLDARIPEKKIIKADFAVTVKMTHGSARFANNSSSNNFEYDSSINNLKSRETKIQTCHEIKIKTDKDGNYELPIIFDVTVKLSSDPRLSEEYDPFGAIISPQSSLTASAPVFAAECRTEVCEPKLEVHVESSLLDTYVTGSSDSERIWITVSNGDGDTAYAARALLYVGAGAEVASARACAWNGPGRALCTLHAGLRANQTWNVTETGPIVLDMTKITSASDELRLRVELSWGKQTKLAPVWERVVKLRHDASKVRLQGKSNQGELVNITKMEIRTGKSLQHTYTIINTHGTNWKGLVCEIWLKKEIYALFEFPIQIYRGSTPLSPPCKRSASSETKEAYLLLCHIGDLYRDDTLAVVIPIYILPEKLESIYDTLNATLETLVILNFNKNGEDIRAHVTTTLTLQQAHVPLWIVLCAAAVGLLLFLLLAFAMYECGCFRRKNKEMLDNLKRDVHRKSVILKRQTMRLSDTERASLANKTYKELLDEAEVKEAEEGFTDGPTPDQTNQPETYQPDQCDQTDKSEQNNHQENLTDKLDALEPDESMSSMSDKKILIENSLKMQKMKKPAAYC